MSDSAKSFENRIKFMKILLAVLMVFTVILVILSLWLAAFCMGEIITGSDLGFTVSEYGTTFAAGLTKALLYVIVFFAMLKAYMLLRDLGAQKTPFTDLMPNGLRTMGWLLILAGVLPGIAEQVMTMVLDAECEYTSYSVALVIVGVVMLVLESVFRIGLELRKDADETV